MDWLGFLFYGGLSLAVMVNIITFCAGIWNWPNWTRGAAMACGIVAAISVGFAGHLNNAKVAAIAEQANSIAEQANKGAVTAQGTAGAALGQARAALASHFGGGL
jgi:hypothetical protein